MIDEPMEQCHSCRRLFIEDEMVSDPENDNILRCEKCDHKVYLIRKSWAEKQAVIRAFEKEITIP